LDCFADPDVLGKIGTDIEECKCSWLFCSAMNEIGANNQLELKKKLITNYGKNAKDSVTAVKEVYNSLDLYKKYEVYEEGIYGEITGKLKNFRNGGIVKVFNFLLAKLHKRGK